MGQARSVLTRAERMAKLQELKKMDPKNPKALGLQKTRVK
jgi:small basic protein (TIGR04137 family)